MRSGYLVWLFFLFSVFLPACESTPDSPVDTSSFTVAANPYMVTAAIVTAEIADADSVSVEYRRDGEEWERTPNFSAADGRYPVIGLYPESHYAFRLVTAAGTSDTVALTTGVLPPLPDVAVTHPVAGVSPGYYLVGFTGSDVSGKYGAVIYDEAGRVVWYRSFAERVVDFQRQENGHFTATVTQGDGPGRTWFDEMNVFGEIVARHESEATPETGVHELRLFADGGRILYGVERPRVDLSAYGGSADAELKQCVVEYRRGGLLFTWKTEDHMVPDDGIDPLSGSAVNPYHVNAIERDTDGNLLISMRNASQIVKVDVGTGEVLWRLGGKRDQFLWLDDPHMGFSRQHGVRRLPNGHILLFDNGNEHTPQASRVAEYSLDEHFKSATLVWEYSDPTLYGFALGFAQRLTDGNTLVCFGTAQVIREVSPEGDVVFQMKVTGNELPYRAFKIDALY